MLKQEIAFDQQLSAGVNVGWILFKKFLGIIVMISLFTLTLAVNWSSECPDDLSFEVI